MARIFTCVFIGLVFSVLIGLLPHATFASRSPWLTDTIVKVSEIPTAATYGDVVTCGGRMGLIVVFGETASKQACVFGSMDGPRVARYRAEGNQYSYGVAYPSDSTFLTVKGLCTGRDRCIYGQEEDTFLVQVPTESGGGYGYEIMKDFSKRLVWSISGGEKQYQLKDSDTQSPKRLINDRMATGAAVVSSTGRWAVIELIGHGIIRFDMKTSEHRRFATRDSLPANATFQPELAISGDGSLMLVNGYSFGPSLYEVANGCGDIVTDNSTGYFASGTIGCNGLPIDFYAEHLEVLKTHWPRFSPDSKKILFDVQKGTKFFVTTFGLRTDDSAEPYYVAFGDSFTSGEGELSDAFYISSTNTAANRCHVSIRSYPYLLGRLWNTLASSFACSGSVISGVRDAMRVFNAKENLLTPTVVSLGIGGNDVDFMGKLKSCIAPGTCEWAKLEKRKATALEIRSLLTREIDLIKETQLNFPSAPLFLVGYPDVINDQPNASCSPLVGTLLNNSERRYMSESIKYLNKVLRAAAYYTKIKFVDIEGAYFGERLCDTEESAMNGIRYGDDMAPIPLLGNFKLIGAESFHPTPRGHQLSAAVINSELQTFWASPTCISSCVFSNSQLDMPEYWLEGADLLGSPLRQLFMTFLNGDAFTSNLPADFYFPAGIFAPNSNVKVELHSEVYELGEYTVGADGVLSGKFIFPPDKSGYHTVHVYGQSPSGEQLNIYQTIYLDTKTNSQVQSRAFLDDENTNRVVLGIRDTVTAPLVEIPTVSISTQGVLGSATTLSTKGFASDTSTKPPPSKKDEALPPKYDSYFIYGGLIVLGIGIYLIIQRSKKHRSRDRQV